MGEQNGAVGADVHPIQLGDQVRQTWPDGSWRYGYVEWITAGRAEVEVQWPGAAIQLIALRRFVDPHPYGDGAMLWTVAP